MKLDKVYVIGLMILLSLTLVLVSLLAVKAMVYRPNVGTDVPFTNNTPASPPPENTAETVTGETVTSPPPYVRKEGKYNFLGVGVDKAAYRADAILLASFDTQSGELAVMQIPRDTYIEYKDGACKINEILRDHGVYAIRDVLEENLCINIDYTALIDIKSLETMIDAIGGVEIDVPFDMKYSDPYQDLYIDIKAGLQVLDGKNAVDFIRYRADYALGDLGRIDAQKKFMSSLFNKVINEITLAQTVTLARRILPMLETDLIVDDAAYFAGKFFAAKERKLVMLTCPGFQLHKTDPEAWYYVLSRGGTLEAVNTYFNVYDKDIAESLFDPNLIFCKEEDDDFLRIYKYSLLSPKPVES